MSTRKLSDKEFDRYVRNILNKPEDVAFDTKAWAAIEGRIGGNQPRTYPIMWIYPMLAILLFVGGYFSFEYFTSVSEETSADTEKTHGFNEEGMVSGRDSTNFLAKKEQGVKSFSEGTLKESQEEISSKSEWQVLTYSKEPLRESIDKKGNEITPEVAKPQEDQVSGKLTEREIASVVNDDDAVASQDYTLPSQEEQNFDYLSGKQLTPGSTGGPYLAFIDDGPIDMEYIPEEENLIIMLDTVEEKVVPQTPYSGWSVGAVFAPDFTTVRELKGFTKPGADFGVAIAYTFLKKFSLTTGAILTRKIYNTNELSEYKIPNGYWTDGVVPEEIAADCKVVDIPINLRYRIVEGKRAALFVSAGMSSYVMLNEIYRYNYEDQTSIGTRRNGLEVSNENNHYFGVYNLSAGVTYQFKKNISLEAEPFIKNSLGGVGWGKVRLKSTGVLFSLKYHIKKN